MPGALDTSCRSHSSRLPQMQRHSVAEAMPWRALDLRSVQNGKVLKLFDPRAFACLCLAKSSERSQSRTQMFFLLGTYQTGIQLPNHSWVSKLSHSTGHHYHGSEMCRENVRPKRIQSCSCVQCAMIEDVHLPGTCIGVMNYVW